MSEATFVIRTGKQGASKTINAIKELDQLSAKTGRTVYYNNVTGFKPDHPSIKGIWEPFDNPHEWFKLPANAIILIDEAQQFFRKRPQGSKVPEYVSALEIMRKDGHELHCITQCPKLLDHDMRYMCGLHVHFVRPKGANYAVRWEFPVPNLRVAETVSFTDAESSRRAIPKEYFGVYQSVKEGTEHHFKFKPPRALYVFAACLVLLGLAAWKISDRVVGNAPEVAEPEQVVQPSRGILATASPASMDDVGVDEYIASRTPRVADVPSSAPRYDQIAQPVTFPKPFCVSTTDLEMLKRNSRRMSVGFDQDGNLAGCRCNSQQGTRVDVSFDFCMNVVTNGLFDDTKPDRQQVAGGDRGTDGGATRQAGADLRLASLISSSSSAESVDAEYVPRHISRL